MKLEAGAYLRSVGEVVDILISSSKLETLESCQVILSTESTVHALGVELSTDLSHMVGSEGGVDIVLVDNDEAALNDILRVWVADFEVNWCSWSSEYCWKSSCQGGELDEGGNHDGKNEEDRRLEGRPVEDWRC